MGTFRINGFTLTPVSKEESLAMGIGKLYELSLEPGDLVQFGIDDPPGIYLGTRDVFVAEVTYITRHGDHACEDRYEPRMHFLVDDAVIQEMSNRVAFVKSRVRHALSIDQEI